MTNPLYSLHDKLYLRESAAIGMLEAVSVSGISLSPTNTWLYSYNQAVGMQRAATYGDRRSMVNGNVILVDESELTDYCTALGLIKANLQQRMNEIDRLRNSCS